MENIIGLKELRQNMASFALKAQKGQSFIVVKQSKPLFRITPLIDLDKDVEKVQQNDLMRDFSFTKKSQKGLIKK